MTANMKLLTTPYCSTVMKPITDSFQLKGFNPSEKTESL